MANVQRGIPAQGAVGPGGAPGPAPPAAAVQLATGQQVPAGAVVSRAGMIPQQQQQIVLTRPPAGMPAGIRGFQQPRPPQAGGPMAMPAAAMRGVPTAAAARPPMHVPTVAGGGQVVQIHSPGQPPIKNSKFQNSTLPFFMLYLRRL